MANAICELLGIECPILLGGMLFVGRAGLTAAVSEAGGLGIMAAGSMDPEELRGEIRRVRELTDKPFGINVPVRSPRAAVLVEVAVEQRVPVVSTSAGDPHRFAAPLKKGGVKLLHVVPTVAHALRAEAAGVDAIVAEGSESGGFINPEEVTTLPLVPQVVDAVRVPVIAAGGIADARGLVAALALGASGVQMGTRFLATAECDIPDDYKRAILLARDTDTVVVRGRRAAHRDLKKELIDQARGLEPGQPTPPQEMVEDFEDGLPEQRQGRWVVRSAGQSAGLVHEILTVRQVIEGMMEGARAILAALPARL